MFYPPLCNVDANILHLEPRTSHEAYVSWPDRKHEDSFYVLCIGTPKKQHLQAYQVRCCPHWPPVQVSRLVGSSDLLHSRQKGLQLGRDLC